MRLVIALMMFSCAQPDGTRLREIKRQRAAIEHYQGCLEMQIKLMRAGMGERAAATKVDELTADDVPCHCVDSLR